MINATTDVRSIAAAAYVWGYPYVAAARLRLARTLPEDPFQPRIETSPGAAINNLGRQRRLSDPRYRVGVGPNTDTLYTSAWLDLRGEPFVLEVPRIQDRYYSFQIGHSDSSSDLSFGSRTHGEQLPPLFIHGPSFTGDAPDGMLAVPSRTRYLNLPGRILVDPTSGDDFAAVHRIQDQVRLRPWSRFRAGAEEGPNPAPDQPRLAPSDADPGLRFLHELGSVLQEEVVPEQDLELVETFAAIGLTTTAGFRGDQVPAAQRDQMEAGLLDGRDAVDRKAGELGIQSGGWTINLSGPRFGDDHLLRAGVARDQIYVTIPEEGIYPVGKIDAAGRPLDGSHRYRLHFAAGALPPARAFWSVTLYDGDGFLVPNDDRVHALGDRTPGVVADDGSATIVIGHERQPGAWLPAPDGPFYLMLRLFVPREEALSGAWLPPPIERVG